MHPSILHAVCGVCSNKILIVLEANENEEAVGCVMKRIARHMDKIM